MFEIIISNAKHHTCVALRMHQMGGGQSCLELLATASPLGKETQMSKMKNRNSLGRLSPSLFILIEHFDSST